MTEGWTDFYLVAGASAAVLLGLLFIALSINREHVTADPILGAQARQAIYALVAIFLISLAVLIPDQSHAALGAELVFLGLALLANAVPRQVWRARVVSGKALHLYLLRVAAFNGGVLLVAAAGASLIADYQDALVLLVPAVVILVLLAIVNSWWLTLANLE